MITGKSSCAATIKDVFIRQCRILNKVGYIYQKIGKYLKYVLLILFLIYLLTSINYSAPNLKTKQTQIQTLVNAFIITNNCTSLRFNAAKENIERVFPNYFRIYCFKAVSLNDSRIHTSPAIGWKKVSSNLLAFVLIWTYEIPKYSKNGELEWSFVFEDDVNFIEPSKVSLLNYINALEEMMENPEIHLNHGVFYLGICGPTFTNQSRPLITKSSNNSLLSYKGYGWCTHGMGLTTKRAKDFWTDITSYRPTPDSGIDTFLRDYCIRSQTEYYTLGSNLHWPPGTGHYGIAFQDRGRFPQGGNR